MREAYARRHPTRPVVFVRVSVRAEAPWFWQGRWPPDRLTGTMDCFEAPRMDLNLIFIKVSAAPTGALGPWKVEEP
jgi:hypothetical protein